MPLHIAPGMPPQKTAFFLFADFFIVVMLAVAIAVPTPTESQWRVFNLVLSLVAASMAAVLPGVFQLKFTPWLRASGALAVFAFVFLIKPAGLVSYDPFKPLGPPPPLELAKPAALDWLRVNDSMNHEMAYGAMRAKFRETYKFDDFANLAKTGRDVFGKVIERSEIGQNASTAIAPERGYYRLYTFMTRFELVSEPIEESVMLFGEESGSVWQPAGYNLNLQKGYAFMKTNASIAK